MRPVCIVALMTRPSSTVRVRASASKADIWTRDPTALPVRSSMLTSVPDPLESHTFDMLLYLLVLSVQVKLSCSSTPKVLLASCRRDLLYSEYACCPGCDKFLVRFRLCHSTAAAKRSSSSCWTARSLSKKPSRTAAAVSRYVHAPLDMPWNADCCNRRMVAAG